MHFRLPQPLRPAALVALALTAQPLRAADAPFPWQEPFAHVGSAGELRWKPEPWAEPKFSSARYIDYESGDDANTGLTPESPWKHHPLDPAARDVAKACPGAPPDAYVFKRGVVYRGSIRGSAGGRGVLLASLPSWRAVRKGRPPARTAYMTGSQSFDADAWTHCGGNLWFVTIPGVVVEVSVYIHGPDGSAVPLDRRLDTRDTAEISAKPPADIDEALRKRIRAATAPSPLPQALRREALSKIAPGSAGGFQWVSDSEHGETCLFVRLPDGLRAPDEHLEIVADPPPLVALADAPSLEITGISFNFAGKTAVDVAADTGSVSVHHCEFAHLGTAVAATDAAAALRVDSNAFHDLRTAVRASTSAPVAILRNIVHSSGDTRSPAFSVSASATLHVAGNMLGDTGDGAAFALRSGDAPAFVHHNSSRRPFALSGGNALFAYNNRLDGPNAAVTLGDGVRATLFNNIVLGTDSAPRAQFAVALGADSRASLFNNHFHHVGDGLVATNAGAALVAAGNVFSDVSNAVFRLPDPVPEWHVLGGNVFHNATPPADAPSAGVTTPVAPYPAAPLVPENPKSPLRGVRPFVPFPLRDTVGEWHFRGPRDCASGGLVLPADAKFGDGAVEEWTASSLRLAQDAALIRNDPSNPSGVFRVGTGDLLVEAIFSTEARKAIVLSCFGERSAGGYRLMADSQGNLVFQFGQGGSLEGNCMTTTAHVADGIPHHDVAEVDRSAEKMRLHLDGRLVARAPMNDALRALDASVPRADMRIGAALHGSISYLRIARTTLAASCTGYRELRAWELSGPARQTWRGETR